MPLPRHPVPIEPRSPVAVSQKREYFKYPPETIGDFPPAAANLDVVRSDFTLNHGFRERNFWMQRQGAKSRHQNARTPTETRIRELSRRKCPQKRPIGRRAGNARFAETGWWR